MTPLRKRCGRLTRTATLLAALGCLGALAGCEQKGANEPKAVSIDQGSSAQRYPAMLARSNQRIRDREAKAKATSEKLPTAIDKISDTDWALVEKIVDASDKAGEDGGYGATMRELEGVRTFHEEEKDAIVRKVGGSAQYVVKQKGCDADVYGAVSQGLRDAVDERMRERLRSSNDAFILIARHEEALGKKNVPALEDLADEIAMTSYTVHVEMPEAKEQLEAVLSGASDARSALNTFIAEEKEYAADAKRKPAEKQASDARVKNAEAQLQALETAETEAKENLKDLEQRAKDLESAYDDGLSKLKDAINAKKPK